MLIVFRRQVFGEYCYASLVMTFIWTTPTADRRYLETGKSFILECHILIMKFTVVNSDSC